MKNYLTSWKKFETELDGEPVSMELLPLKRSTMFKITPLVAKQGEMAKTPQGSISQSEIFEITNSILDAMVPVIDLHVKNIEGFTVDGAAPIPSQLLEQASFSNFILSIVMELFVRSTLKEKEVRD